MGRTKGLPQSWDHRSALPRYTAEALCLAPQPTGSVSNNARVVGAVFARLVECCPNRQSDDIAFAACALGSCIWHGRCLDMTMAPISNLFASCASGAE